MILTPVCVLSTNALGHALGARLLRHGLAEEIVLGQCRQAVVRVAAADQPELVGVGAERLFELQAGLERRARILELEHLGRLPDAAVEVALVPDLEVGEFVGRRQDRVRLARTLGLRHLVQALPAGARLGVGAVHRLAERLDDREHESVAQVAVVRDGEHAPARLVLVGLHPLPEVRRIVAAVRRIHGERVDLDRLVAAVAVDRRCGAGCCRRCSRSTRSR